MVAVIEVNPLYLWRWHLAREEAEVAIRPQQPMHRRMRTPSEK